ncbi:microcin C transport system substrate-binding protein [Azotobacter beijerinckii]|uniref:Microcin C transport system substrate-binding protein n=1 Tax=Azotobacter beijerinckii TaxID=170623 RepID=A0A1H6T0N5_9GAMM|nr:extracellular solute-binding protein [Azotobacter beijerinckii]SEI70647.1 microcin C transport system substrate-binding protein [Azotobacter beijerinckii]
MTRPLRSLLLAAGSSLLLGLAGLAQAAPQHALTLYGEAPKYPPGFPHFDYVNPTAPQGGTLRQAGFGSFDSLNPFINKGVAADEIGLVYDTLTRHGLDEPFTEYGLLAEKIEKAPDNSWVRFYLRPEARFHDGHPVTAEDVVFSFDTLMKDGAPMYRAYYADVSRAVAEDERRVRFDFKHAGNRELPLILGQLAVLPKHWWAGRDFTKSGLEPPLGSGPYRVADVQPGRSIRYERVKDWWGKDLPVSRGFYNFDAMQVDYYRDNTVALEALKAGQFDYWLETSAKNWATAYDTPAVKNGQLIKEEIANNNPAGMQGFIFNIRRPLFQDRRVREALGLLFDFEWTNRQLFNGAYTRTRSYFDNSELASRGLPDAAELKILEPLREQIPPEVFSREFQLPVSDASGIVRDQQRRAYQLLQEAGWRVEGDRMLDAKGQPVRIEFLLAQAEFERILLPYKRNLADLGIDLEIRRVDLSQYINRLRSRDFDMMVGGFSQSNSPGNEQREYWHSVSADNPGSRNFIGLKDPAIDRLVDGLIQADTRDSLIGHTRALDRVLLWGYYVVPNWHIKTWRVAYWNRLGHPTVTPRYDIGLYTWWSKPQAAATPVAPASTER